MKAGGGKKHGRFWIGDGIIETSSTPTLSQIRAQSTSSSSSIRSRPEPTVSRIRKLESQLEEERRQRVASERAIKERYAADRAYYQEQLQTLFARFGEAAPAPPLPPPHAPDLTPPSTGSNEHGSLLRNKLLAHQVAFVMSHKTGK